ncbi:male-specific lethal 3 [Plakobranchus ocellatus]|uniref:Male-specific lethal 3 n=1 Tax=Plakobranchus ocellatus TaxID=259542 RepID=A0AAV3XWK5_9GAST|nr:male-specific lethal 3 [Plakobranchus ocellatus]
MAKRGLRFEYAVTEMVLCFEPDCTKARVLYDAKVVERRVVKDENGKRHPAYVVHFQGWNSSWDREVGEHYLLRNTDENRELMKKLADAAKKFSRKNSQRRRKINAILHQAFGGAPPQFDDSETDESEDETDNAMKKANVVEFDLPDILKEHLENDYILINKKNKLTNVPAKPCVIDILESFMKTFCVNYLCDPSGGREKTRTSSSKHTLKCPPDKCISLCKEFVDSLRIIFDFTLPIILLYAAEQEQYESASAHIKYSDLQVKEKDCGSFKDANQQKVASAVKGKSERAKRSHQSRSPSPTSSAESEGVPDIPPRRLTRQAAHFECPISSSPSSGIRQRSLSHQPHKLSHREDQPPVKITRKSMDSYDGLVNRGEDIQAVIPIASRTRRRSLFEVVEVSESSPVKQEPVSDGDNDPLAESLPGPSQVNGKEGPCSAAGTESLTLGSSHGREDAMDKILGWQLLPAEVKARGPVTPSQVYGVVHLLRMFVKLPDLLKKMHLKDVHLQIIIKFVHHCLQYLVDHQGNLINDQIYIKA